jgi:hypothetical protein
MTQRFLQQNDDVDMDAIWQLHRIAFATVLAGTAGIRATVPLFVLSLAHLVDSEDVPLSDATQWLGHWYICVGLAVLLILEILADMIPAVDHALHAVLTPIFPITGAVVAAAPSYGGGWFTHVPMAIAGSCLAFASHSGKAASRVGVNASSGCTGGWVMSLGGTFGAISVAIIAATFVILSIILAILVIVGCIYAFVKVRQIVSERSSMRKAAMPVIAAVRWRRQTQHHRKQTNGAPPLPEEQVANNALAGRSA